MLKTTCAYAASNGARSAPPSFRRCAAPPVRCVELKLSPVFQVPLTDICALSFAPVLDNPQSAKVGIKLLQFKTGGNLPTFDPASLVWSRDDDYDDVVAELGDFWARTGMYPGDEEFARFELADIVSNEYRAQIDAAFIPADHST